MMPDRQLRLLVVDNFQIRRYGKGREGQGYRFACGAVRKDWRVMTFSERDITRFLAPLGFLRNVGAAMMNRRLLRTCVNFRPDLVLIGHCDYVTNARRCRGRSSCTSTSTRSGRRTPWTRSARAWNPATPSS